MRLLTKDFTYARYKPLTYFEGEVEEQQRQSQRNLAKFMKILMVKRLESSFQAFRLTLDRFLRSYARMIEEFRKGHLYISKKHIQKIFDLLETDDQEGIDRLLEADKAERLDAKDFNADFIRDLENDLKTLRHIEERWKGIKRDPKWESFRDMLRKDPRLKKGKPILFTESKETAEYLAKKIADELEPDVLLFTGSSDESVRKEVIANFDAKAFQPKNQYRILFATEVLSEGVNLHRSNIVINYDIPWNPTRLIQRVGRVNRVDTTFDTIHTYNFFPTEKSNDVIKLKESAEAKIHGFTDEDELYIRQVIQLLIDGALPRPTTKKVADALKREIEPLKVLGILRRDIPSQFFQATRAQAAHHSLSPREVILSSWLVQPADG